MFRTLRPLSLGQLLGEACSLYSQHFLLFLSISAVPNLALLLLQLALGTRLNDAGRISEVFESLAGLGASFASLYASSVVTAATTLAVSDIYLDQPPDMWDCFARLSGKAFRVVYAAFLVELIVGVGSLLCLVPGLFWAGKYGITVPAVVLENISARQALRRSASLTSGSAGRIIISFFLTSILSGILTAILNATVIALAQTLPTYRVFLTSELLRHVTATVGVILFGPITAIMLALEYYDQRVCKEGFDIEQLRRARMFPEGFATGASVS